MLLKKLSELTLADIESLRDNGIPESRFIDYKSCAVGGRDEEKKEFLADVSAFANASGGDIILGVRDHEGLPDEIVGVETEDVDKEKLRLGDLIRSGLEPRLSTVDLHWIPIESKRGIMIVRVPRSWAAPHRVVLKGHMQFYMRNAAGKHPMNVDDLRQAFGHAESVANRIRAFRDERIKSIVDDELPFTLQAGVKVVVHVVPTSSATDPQELNLLADEAMVHPLGATGFNWRYCLEGLATYPGKEPLRAYSLMFRTGAVECVAAIGRQTTEGKFLNLSAIESAVLQTWRQYKLFAAKNDIEPPVSIFVAILDVMGFAPVSDPFFDHEQPIIFRKSLLKLPEVWVGVDEFANNPSTLFKRLFDVTSNAFGLERSQSYDSGGNYVGAK